MTHIKRFFESNQIHSRLSVEEIEDYFLEFIQAGDIHFLNSGIPIGQTYVAVYFEVDRKFYRISDSSTMLRFSKLLQDIDRICDRWKLDYQFQLNGINNRPNQGGVSLTQLEIRQPVPQIVLDQFPQITTPHFDMEFEDRQYRFMMWLKHDELTMDFYIVFEPMTTRDGSGANGKWLKEDWVHFAYHEKDIINQLQSDYSKIIPCQYSDKVQASRDLHYNHRKYKYKFKLLV